MNPAAGFGGEDQCGNKRKQERAFGNCRKTEELCRPSAAHDAVGGKPSVKAGGNEKAVRCPAGKHYAFQLSRIGDR